MSTAERPIILASRASELAQIQTNIVLAALKDAFPNRVFSTSFMRTAGDKNQSTALYLLGGKALWTKELEVALKDGEVDMLIHSCKDVPTALPEGCALGAILEREDPVDCLVVKAGKPWKSLDELPAGSVIGTSSVRRVAQLGRLYPQLVFQDVRGNLNTRLAKLDAAEGPYSALILAKAGLVRLGWGSRVTADLRPPTLFYAVAQGALAVEVREDDDTARELCEKLTHWPSLWRCLAERECLRVLEGGCSVPVGIDSTLEIHETKAGVLTLTGCVTSLDGSIYVEQSIHEEVGSASEAEKVGSRLARALIDNGAKTILDDITRDRYRRTAQAKKEENNGGGRSTE